MVHLFIGYTPFHVFLAYGIARAEAARDSRLLVVADGPGLDSLAGVIRSDPQSPFAAVHLISGVWALGDGLRARLAARANMAVVEKLVRRARVERVYVFNDSRPESQAALRRIKSQNQDVVAVYVEDGAAAYASHRRQRPVWAWVMAKLLYGWQWKDLSVIGSSPYIDEVVAVFPNLVRSQLRTKPVRGLPVGTLGALLAARALFTRYVEALGGQPETLAGVDSILLLAHSVLVEGSRYGATVRALCEAATLEGRHLAVKHHPLEPVPGSFVGQLPAGVITLPQAAPAEVLYLLGREKLRCVVGDVSTGLITARWLLRDGAQITSLAPLLGWDDPSLLATYEILGIHKATDLRDLRNAFSLQQPA